MFADGRMVVLLRLIGSVCFVYLFWLKLGLASASTDTQQVGSSHI